MGTACSGHTNSLFQSVLGVSVTENTDDKVPHQQGTENKNNIMRAF